VRELEHLISRAALKTLSQAASRRELLSIDAAGLGLELPAAEDAVEIPAPSTEDARSLQEVVDDYQRRLLQRALQRHGGKWAAAARALKMDPSNLRKLARRLDLR
jgi:anaerobic nitric oxide reductase transcription regulator